MITWPHGLHSFDHVRIGPQPTRGTCFLDCQASARHCNADSVWLPPRPPPPSILAVTKPTSHIPFNQVNTIPDLEGRVSSTPDESAQAPLPTTLETVLREIEAAAQSPSTLRLGQPEDYLASYFSGTFSLSSPYEQDEVWENLDMELVPRIGADTFTTHLRLGPHGIDGLLRGWLTRSRAFAGWDSLCDMGLGVKLNNVLGHIRQTIIIPQPNPSTPPSLIITEPQPKSHVDPAPNQPANPQAPSTEHNPITSDYQGQPQPTSPPPRSPPAQVEESDGEDSALLRKFLIFPKQITPPPPTPPPYSVKSPEVSSTQKGPPQPPPPHEPELSAASVDPALFQITAAHPGLVQQSVPPARPSGSKDQHLGPIDISSDVRLVGPVADRPFSSVWKPAGSIPLNSLMPRSVVRGMIVNEDVPLIFTAVMNLLTIRRRASSKCTITADTPAGVKFQVKPTLKPIEWLQQEPSKSCIIQQQILLFANSFTFL